MTSEGAEEEEETKREEGRGSAWPLREMELMAR